MSTGRQWLVLLALIFLGIGGLFNSATLCKVNDRLIEAEKHVDELRLQLRLMEGKWKPS